MSKSEKRLQRLRETDKGWRFNDLKTLAEAEGIQVLPGRGDHWKFRAPGRPPVTVDPGAGNEVLRCYVRAVRELVEAVRDANEREDPEDPES